MILRRDAPIECDLDTLTVDPDHEEVRRLFDFLEFKSLHDRLYEALSIQGTAPPAASTSEVLSAEVTELSSADEVRALLESLAQADVAPVWMGEPGRSSFEGIAVVADAAAADVRWIGPALVRDDAVLGVLAKHPTGPRPQRQAADPRAARAGDRDAGARARHGDRRLPHRPGRDPLRDRRPAGQVHELPARPGGPGRRRDSSTSATVRRRRTRGPAPRRSQSRTSATHSPARSTSRAWPSSTTRWRTRSSSCWRGWSTPASRSTTQELRALNQKLTERVRAARRRAAASGRPTVQLQLADPAPRHPLHRARPVARQEDEDRVLHRRGDAGEAARPVARVHRPAAPVPRGREAARHLRRRVCSSEVAARPSHPRDVQPDRRPHRSAEQRPPEPPQHPGPPRGGQAVPQGVRAGGRAASCSSPTTTRSSCAASLTSPRTLG